MLYVSFGLVLSFFWIVLSGHYTVVTVTAGVFSVLGTIALARRMQLIDEEGHPIHLLFRGLVYWPWLVVEIAKASWDVTRIILHPKLPISPVLIRVKASQNTSVGIATYANSITLTPGTITARVSGHEFLIHALTCASAKDLASGAIDDRVRQFEAGS